MTEIGMALTNPYNQDDRKPGHVGQPFPNVQVRIVAAGSEDDVVVEGHYKGSHRVKGTGSAEDSDLVSDLQVHSAIIMYLLGQVTMHHIFPTKMVIYKR